MIVGIPIEEDGLSEEKINMRKKTEDEVVCFVSLGML